MEQRHRSRNTLRLAFSFPVQFYDTIIEFAYAADAILKEDPTRAPSSIRGAALYEALTKTRTVGMQGRVVIDEYGLKEGHFVIRNVWGTSLPHALRPLPIRVLSRLDWNQSRGASRTLHMGSH